MLPSAWWYEPPLHSLFKGGLLILSCTHYRGRRRSGGGSVFLLAAYNSKKKKVGKTTQIQGANYPEDKIIHHITAMVNDWMVNSSVWSRAQHVQIQVSDSAVLTWASFVAEHQKRSHTVALLCFHCWCSMSQSVCYFLHETVHSLWIMLRNQAMISWQWHQQMRCTGQHRQSAV